MEEEIKPEETKEASEKAPEENAEEKPLDKMTAPELRETAKAIPGVSGVHAMKKDELLAVIKEFRGIKDEEPPKKKETETKKSTISPKELKLKIARLREERDKARESKNKKDVDILRRRINRMKKQTRKVAHA
ncbi:MAG: transcription termination factor Rho [Deltaproteobacteria bacterium]|nr:transcription termination factor Rho [Deltaproteobacteria bacterium]